MFYHDYRDGLKILEMIEININEDEINDFKIKFDYYSEPRKKMQRPMGYFSLFSISLCAYSNIKANGDKSLEINLRNSLSKKIREGNIGLSLRIYDNLEVLSN